jgi:predicted amino acid-binding ACT domain protein
MNLIVVGQFGSDQPGVAAAVREVLQANQAELYITQEVPRLLELIRASAKPSETELPT